MLESETTRETLREYQVLNEMERNERLSQRDLGRLVGLNISTINQIVKRLVRKGCVKTRPINGRKLAYCLTSQGFAEKLRLVMRYTQCTIGFFTAVRELVNHRLSELKDEHGIQTIAIVGIGELAEAVYLSVREQGLDLTAVYDGEAAGNTWLGLPVYQLREAEAAPADAVVVTEMDLSRVKREHLAKAGKRQVDMGRLLSNRLAAFARRVEKEKETSRSVGRRDNNAGS